MSSPFSVKAQLADDIRRVRIPTDVAGAAASLGATFATDPALIQLYWTDEDGDLITIKTDDDLQEAIRSGASRLLVKEGVSPAVTTTSPVATAPAPAPAPSPPSPSPSPPASASTPSPPPASAPTPTPTPTLSAATPPTPTTAGDAAQDLSVHYGVVCDISGMNPITGARYQMAGYDYDLCEAEFNKLSEEDRSNFVVIATRGAKAVRYQPKAAPKPVAAPAPASKAPATPAAIPQSKMSAVVYIHSPMHGINVQCQTTAGKARCVNANRLGHEEIRIKNSNGTCYIQSVRNGNNLQCTPNGAVFFANQNERLWEQWDIEQQGAKTFFVSRHTKKVLQCTPSGVLKCANTNRLGYEAFHVLRQDGTAYESVDAIFAPKPAPAPAPASKAPASAPASKPAAAAAAEPVEAVHHHVSCDKSGMNPIIGARYHLAGVNYDLCEAEFNKLPEAEKAKFVVIAHRGARPAPYGQEPAAAGSGATEAAGFEQFMSQVFGVDAAPAIQQIKVAFEGVNAEVAKKFAEHNATAAAHGHRTHGDGHRTRGGCPMRGGRHGGGGGRHSGMPGRHQKGAKVSVSLGDRLPAGPFGFRSFGPGVAQLQIALIKAGVLDESAIRMHTGKYGPRTAEAVCSLQMKYSLGGEPGVFDDNVAATLIGKLDGTIAEPVAEPVAAAQDVEVEVKAEVEAAAPAPSPEQVYPTLVATPVTVAPVTVAPSAPAAAAPPPSKWQSELEVLAGMGFTDNAVLVPLLEKHTGSIIFVMTELLG